MYNLLSTMNSAVAVTLILTLGCVIIAAIAVIADAWARTRRAELEASLKAEMISRGMSVDEIERVLKAPLGKLGGKTRAPSIMVDEHQVTDHCQAEERQ